LQPAQGPKFHELDRAWGQGLRKERHREMSGS
jgi:hypothetical protein